eukprot:1150527-Pelagomonas_calceolata.AAC.3
MATQQHGRGGRAIPINLPKSCSSCIYTGSNQGHRACSPLNIFRKRAEAYACTPPKISNRSNNDFACNAVNLLKMTKTV